MAKKVLIIGPIGDRGGREIETAFICQLLISKGFGVEILSTSYLTEKSTLSEYLDTKLYTSINAELYKTKYIFKVLASLSWIKNGIEFLPYKYCNNKLAKKYFNYYHEVEKILRKFLCSNDLIFFIGQLSSNYNKQIIDFSTELNKPLLFRTTGKINNKMNISSYFAKVSLFIHHGTFNNSSNLMHINSNVAYIDQACINESALLDSEILEKKISKFIYVGEMSTMKGVQFLAKCFHKVAGINDELIFVGDGDLLNGLRSDYRKDKRMRFLGQISHLKVAENLKKSDCLIISSITETGPYVGLEAMAAGRLILSTKVGSMPERLRNSGNDFWFNENDFEDFCRQYNKIKNLNISEVHDISTNLKKRYLLEYSNQEIGVKYNDLINRIFVKNDFEHGLINN